MLRRLYNTNREQRKTAAHVAYNRKSGLCRARQTRVGGNCEMRIVERFKPRFAKLAAFLTKVREMCCLRV